MGLDEHRTFCEKQLQQLSLLSQEDACVAADLESEGTCCRDEERVCGNQ